MKRFLLLAFLPLLLLSAGLCGCLNLKPEADPTRFYVLSASPAKEPWPDAARLSLPVCVAKVETPAYLDNPGLAVRREGNLISYAQYHQWAEPVHLGVSRCLSEHLSGLLGAGRVNSASRRYQAGDCLEVQAVLSRFETTASGQAVLAVRWRIVQTGSGEILHAEISEFTSGLAKAALDYNAAVQALSETIAQWSQQVAKALLAQHSGTPPASEKR